LDLSLKGTYYMPNRGTETEFELTTIERLERKGFTYVSPDNLERPLTGVVLKDRLQEAIKIINPGLPQEAVDEAVKQFSVPYGADTLRRNMSFHEMLTRGIELSFDIRTAKGRERKTRHIYAVDWDHTGNNEFLVSNQYTIEGKNERRPDIIVFVNGFPLVVFELKNPYEENPAVEHAVNQIFHYRNDIP
jgi:type I restriction enzyme R subunit